MKQLILCLLLFLTSCALLPTQKKSHLFYTDPSVLSNKIELAPVTLDKGFGPRDLSDITEITRLFLVQGGFEIVSTGTHRIILSLKDILLPFKFSDIHCLSATLTILDIKEEKPVFYAMTTKEVEGSLDSMVTTSWLIKEICLELLDEVEWSP